MKVLIATREGQGQRANDFCWTREGELVDFGGFTCTGEKIDGKCGCNRSMGGIYSFKATTTFTVADRKLTRNQFISKWKESQIKAGWGWHGSLSEAMADKLLKTANKYPVGTILERRGSKIQPRIIKRKNKSNQPVRYKITFWALNSDKIPSIFTRRYATSKEEADQIVKTAKKKGATKINKRVMK